MNAPPADRGATQRPSIGPPPSWLPTDRNTSIILVALLVLLATIFQTRLAPGLRAEADSGIVVPIGTPEGETEPTAAATAAGMRTGPAADSTPVGGSGDVQLAQPILPDMRVVAYYGHPFALSMGILGQFNKRQLLEQLQDVKRAYERADPERPVVMAFEVIGSVAQPEAGQDGSYLLWTDSETIREYVEFAQENGILLIIDIQIGRTSVEEEIAIIEEFLIEPNVHLAIDPEFAMGPDQVPNVDIGGVDADDVNFAQEELARMVEEHDLPPKLLIVHRFTDGMVTNSDDIDEVDKVQVVLDFDGFGDPASKEQGYSLYAGEEWVRHAGIKLFYDQDQPLMQPEEVIELDPAPDFVMYQ